MWPGARTHLKNPKVKKWHETRLDKFTNVEHWRKKSNLLTFSAKRLPKSERQRRRQECPDSNVQANWTHWILVTCNHKASEMSKSNENRFETHIPWNTSYCLVLVHDVARTDKQLLTAVKLIVVKHTLMLACAM